MTGARIEFHSPLTLLTRWMEEGNARLREVLITGFTLDLAFLERHFIGPARALGARITVLSDPHHSVHDAIEIRHAGRTYQHGNASCSGAFHPKLVLMVGEEEVWAAIGSGNPTTSGWGHNDELWLVLRSGLKQGPPALLELSDWLSGLPAAVSMPSWIAETVLEVAAMIVPEDLDGSLPDLRILGNLDRPLISQLPLGPTDVLRMYAPFFDPASAAVNSLIDKLRPQRAVVAVQPRWSQFHGEGLVEAISELPTAEFRLLDENRLRHGKLVEWTSDGRVTALVGSANITRAAMLKATQAGGNCELAAMYPAPHTLMPDGAPISPANLRVLSTIPAAEQRPKPAVPVTILGARRQQDLIGVELLSTGVAPISIEASATGAPGDWRVFHIHQPERPGPVHVSFSAPPTFGEAIRAVVESADGRHVTPVVFLTDSTRCLSRSTEPAGPRLVREYTYEELFSDAELARIFDRDLNRLLRVLADQRSPGGRTQATGPRLSTANQDDRWGNWLTSTERRLGPSLTGLVLPGVLKRETAEPTRWSVDLEDPGLDIIEDEDAEEFEPEEDRPESGYAPHIDPALHQLWRQNARRMRLAVSAEPAPPLELRMLVAVMHYNLLAAGVWGEDPSWRAGLAEVLLALVKPDQHVESVDKAEQYVASLIAIGLALLAQNTDLWGGTQDDILLQTVWAEVGIFAAVAEMEFVEDYLRSSEEIYAQVVGPSDVESVIVLAQLSVDDPLAKVHAALDAAGFSVERVKGVWRASTDREATVRVAAQIATIIDGSCAVLVDGSESTCAFLREGAVIAVAQSTQPQWRLFRLSIVGTPSSALGGGDGQRPWHRCSRSEPSPELQALAKGIGVDLSKIELYLHTVRLGNPPEIGGVRGQLDS
ncbi:MULTISPECIES: hypothetical protein [Rhodococcus]|uniref:hypothetical protein n=1 Tax=Rhodococcus TaxID=1827 RepID=UPI0006BA1B4E|nr:MULTISPECIES: hypothetical protein [Rhodococcus]